MAKESDLLLANQLKTMAKQIQFTNGENETAKGFMTFGQVNNGLRTMDFMFCEDVTTEAFTTKCKVQVMRDGNVYLTEQKRRVKNRPIFRDDNMSLSLGRNEVYYVVFTLPKNRITELPKLLVKQATAIALKVTKELIIKRMKG